MKFYYRHTAFKVNRFLLWIILIVAIALMLILAVIRWFDNKITRPQPHTEQVCTPDIHKQLQNPLI